MRYRLDIILCLRKGNLYRLLVKRNSRCSLSFGRYVKHIRAFCKASVFEFVKYVYTSVV